MKEERTQVKSRNQVFTERPVTRIWLEQPAENNPYLAESVYCHGYDLMALIRHRSFVDVLYLLFRGELPSSGDAELLESLMVASINPGPRHAATRAAMNAGVGKTDPVHILPISLMTLGGQHLGAGEIDESMGFLRKQQKNAPKEVIKQLLVAQASDQDGDMHIAPGFGSRFGGIDPMPTKMAAYLVGLSSSGRSLQWGCEFAEGLEDHNMGWLHTGVVAAVLNDLGFHPRAAAGLYQFMCAPGLLAHGIELSNKPLTAMPFVKDENYVIEYK